MADVGNAPHNALDLMDSIVDLKRMIQKLRGTVLFCPLRLLAGLSIDPVNSLIDVSEYGSKTAAILAHGFAEPLWIN